ncbi:MAG: hypothetical protein IJ721_05460 [Bacteroidales bacterium]|nr:hypothetical protein [Bacteroidales bacterium]
MKKFLYISILAALMLPSCGKDGAERPSRGSIVLDVSTEASFTRAMVAGAAGSSFPVLWQEGDRISLNGSLSSPLPAGSAGDTRATFSFTDFPGDAPYQLLYPGNADGKAILDGTVPAMYASGSSLTESFTLHQLGCGLRVLLHGGLSLASLSLSAPGEEALAGTFSVDFENGSLSPVSAWTSISHTFSSPPDISATVPFYFFFAPGTYAEGLVLKAEAPDGYARKWYFATGRTLVKGRMYQPEELDFSFEEEPSDGDIECSLEGLDGQTVDFEP